ncbi:hypothetical protein [Curvivirga aplysinae]|uniref:hypothetical protein n=1 Tax=Curvivirga aplysinae TaxID=2529852 RepID=UPI0012BCE185|nr:hypothetical protein [Curvivirga aplysinae]MTI11367.1 hypothetical protein [Curvivirga aplysinae]
MQKDALLKCLEQVLDIISIVEGLEQDHQQELYVEVGIGRHIRHIADHLQAFILAVESGVLDYNLRRRGHSCEENVASAREMLEGLYINIQQIPFREQDLEVISEVDVSACQTSSFKSNISREILYLINHTIHHTAYISLLAKTRNVTLPASIVLAPATATFLRAAS